MSLHLRFAAPERDEHREGQQLAHLHVQASAGQEIAEAVVRQVTLDVLLVRGGRLAHPVDTLRAENRPLHRQPLFEAVRGRGRRLPRKRQRHAARLQHLVRNPYEVGDLRHADVGNGLIKRLLHLDGRHSGVQRTFERRPVGSPALRGDVRGQDAQHARPRVELAVGGHFAERKVTKNFK